VGFFDKFKNGGASGRGLSAEEMEQLYQSFASPELLNSNMGIARGEAPGNVDPRLQRPIGELSQIDRFTDTRRMNPVQGAIYAGVLGPAWEGYKALAQAGMPEARGISNLLARPEVPPELQQFSVTGPGKTSPASLANLKASLFGMLNRLKAGQQRVQDTNNIHPMPRVR
jgi:hypothetical protein